MGEMVEGAPAPLRDVLDRAARMAASPIVTVNLWFDRPVLHEPFIGLPGRVMQWVFEKGQVESGAWHVSMVSSGAQATMVIPPSQLVALAQAELVEALPSARAARQVRAAVVPQHRATFSLAPGQPARPAVETPIAGFYLAGDWIETGLPATIESAVRSGHAAADAALRRLRGASSTS
jgi:predicted NAD/FAD-dependent oxidoreductase